MSVQVDFAHVWSAPHVSDDGVIFVEDEHVKSGGRRRDAESRHDNKIGHNSAQHVQSGLLGH